MRITNVTPHTFQSALNASVAGDVIRLGDGTYADIYTLDGQAGRADAPILIEMDPSLPEGSVRISQGRDAEWYRPQANRIAREREEIGKYPGLWHVAHKARLRIVGCSHITIRNLGFELSWPTHVYIDQSTHVTLQDCHFTDATFCIFANGQNTQDIVLDGCTWTQDRVPNRIWSWIAWKRIHGSPDHEECSWSVKDDDYRLFDGDFFRAESIRGGVTVRNCTVSNAFNGVHAEGNGDNRTTNRDFHIHDCRFIQIRDNAIEPEENAINWSVHDNMFIDNHSPFSLACEDLSHIYVFSNLFAFRSIQGTSGPDPVDVDCNRGGKAFKLKGMPQKPHGPNYVFHNSMIARMKYLPKGVFEGLRHFNNAIAFVPMGSGTFDKFPTFYGNPSGAAPEKRFTPKWSDLNGYAIRMNGDVVLAPGWPDDQRNVGYAIGSDANGADPGFARNDLAGSDVKAADFATAAGGPCYRTGVGFDVELPDGQVHRVSSGYDVGAMQRDQATGNLTPFQGPPFQRTLGAGLV